jgi:ATP-dependent Clp protease protease subunit
MRRMNLLKLLIDNQGKAAKSGAKAEGEALNLYVYDVIGGIYGGVDGEEMVKAIRAHSGPINVFINSPGGDVFEARAISAALRSHAAPVTGFIDGWAASAATDIACACDSVEISEGGFYMIHNAWTFAIGNKGDMLETAALLEKIDNSIAGFYAAKSGKDEDYMKQLMDAETWFTAAEAVEVGLVDKVSDKKASASNWNLSAYEHAPKVEPVEQPENNEFEAMQAMRERRLSLLERAPA